MNETIKEENVNMNQEYDPSKSKEIETLEPGIIIKGVIIKIESGTYRKFIPEQYLGKFKNPDQTCIKIHAEGKFKDRFYSDTELIGYFKNEKGIMEFTTKSKMGKFNKYYKKLPVSGGEIHMKTDADGFFKIIIE